MDTDSSLVPLALVFGASLLLFAYLSLAEHAASVGNGRAIGKPQHNFSFVVSSLKNACIIAASISGLALALSTQTLGWWWAAMLALTLLAILTVINRCLYIAATRGPVKSRQFSAPLHRWLLKERQRRPNNGSSETDDDPDIELEERVIAAADSARVDERDREMLRSILRLDVSTVREIMVPRLDMVAVNVNSSLSEVAESMGLSGHSRLPVFEDNLDTIVGIVHSRDLLTMLSQSKEETSLRDAMRPAFFIPESKRLDDLLEELQQKALQMAIVVDEYGGSEGLVTMEDLLEEIVGEIEDEFSRVQDPEVIRYPDGSALVDAGVTTDDVKVIFGAELDSADVDTLGGFVYQSLGRIPQTGDIVLTDNLRIEVVSILGRRLRKLRITPINEDSVTQTAD